MYRQHGSPADGERRPQAVYSLEGTIPEGRGPLEECPRTKAARPKAFLTATAYHAATGVRGRAYCVNYIIALVRQAP